MAYFNSPITVVVTLTVLFFVKPERKNIENHASCSSGINLMSSHPVPLSLRRRFVW